MSRDFTVEHVTVRTDLAGAAPGFVICVADGVASTHEVGNASAFLVDRATYVTEVRS